MAAVTWCPLSPVTSVPQSPLCKQDSYSRARCLPSKSPSPHSSASRLVPQVCHPAPWWPATRGSGGSGAWPPWRAVCSPFRGSPHPSGPLGTVTSPQPPRAAGGERLIPGSSSNSSLHCAWAFSTGRNASHPESVLRASGAERVDTARICGGPTGFAGFLQNDAGLPLAISLRHTHIPVRGSAVAPQGARLASGQRGAAEEEARRTASYPRLGRGCR